RASRGARCDIPARLARPPTSPGVNMHTMNTAAPLQAASLAYTRQDFPILGRNMGDRPLIFLDSAASSQKPRQVVEAMSEYYYSHHANVHRGAYRLSREATGMFESVRERLAAFIG